MPESRPARTSPHVFADWVFHQINPGYRSDPHAPTTRRFLWSGKYEHEQIERLRLWMRENTAVADWANRDEPWRCVYADPPDKKDGRLFTASALLINGAPVRGRPDVVLRNDRRDCVLILERKVVHTVERRWERLRAGYVSNWCQTWCYGWIDDWVDVREVMLILQYRYRDRSRGGYSEPLDVVPARFRRDPRFHAEMLGWFHRYGGEFRPPSLSR